MASLQKLEISQEELEKWLRESWQEYASCTVAGEQLRFMVNGFGMCKIVRGDRVLFSGTDIQKVVEVWDAL